MSQQTIDKPSTDTDVDTAFAEILRNEEVVKDDDTGDHDRFSHYAQKEKILESSMTGKPIRALCGKIWTPSKNPEKYPVCPDCKQVYESLKDE